MRKLRNHSFSHRNSFVRSIPKTTLTVVLSLLLTICLHSQNNAKRTITGIITEASSGDPLIGVSVLVKGTTTGTVTDIDGQYEISVAPQDSILSFSYIGYQKEEVNINGSDQVDIRLVESASSLDEVIVVGYGVQQKANLTGSVARIDNQDIANRPVTQASQALHGLAPGVFINTDSGEPGNDQSNIIIRGVGTLNNSNPLILVDGIEAPINSVNPNDIESINVLKDAASASIYGSRAANGVILITTKRGNYDEKTTINYDGYVGVSNPTVLPDMVWDNRLYMELYREGAINSNRSFGFDDSDVERYAAIPGTDWMEELTRENAPITSHNLSFSGGTNKLSYYFSAGYLYQESFLDDNTQYNRYSIRLNLDSKLTDKLTFGTSLSYFNEDGRLTAKDQTGRSFANKGSLVFSGAMIQHPMTPVFDQFGRYGSIEAALGIERNRPSGQGVADNETIDLRANDFLGNAFLEFEPTKGLKFRATVGVNYQDEILEDIKKEYVTYDPVTGEPWTNGNGTRNRGSIIRLFNQNTINVTSWLQGTYERSFGGHNLKLLGGFNTESSDIKRTDVDEREFGTASLVSIGNGTLINTNGLNGEWFLASFFGRLNYDFNEKYLLEFNLRRDGSSRFGANNRWATFPAISAGWIVSRESFWKLDAINYLKIRGSWGKLGNQSSNLYPFASQVGLGEDYTGNSGAALTRLGNPDLRWEETTTTDIGLDIGLWEGRINIEADYFIKETEDILTDLDNPLTSGIAASTTVNAASMENKGWEAAVSYKDNFGKVRFNIGFNVTNVKNEVTAINPALADDDDKIRLSTSDNVWIIRGEPINTIYGHQVEGIFQSQAEIDGAPDHSFIGTPGPGDFRYTDTDGDGVITENDQVVIGNRQPEWLYGANLRVEYGGFDFSALLQGIGKSNVWIARMYGPFPFAGIRSYWEDRWTPDNPQNEIPRLWIDRQGFNGRSIATSDRQNSFWVQDRAYLRLKNIQLGYTLPKSVTENSFIENLRVYINGQNVWTDTDLLDIDPERFSTESHATNVLPQNKIWSFGVNATF